MAPTSVEPRAHHGLRACGLLIAGAFVLLVALFFAFLPSPIETQSVKVIQPPAEPRVRLATPGVFDAEAFKRTIIENNLFRPLGWSPPRPIEPYRLIGTLLPRDDTTAPQAILQTTAGDRTYIVSIGDHLSADTEVVSIQGKAVTLETDGQRRTLKLSTHYLNPSRVSPRFASQRPTPVRPHPRVRRTPPRAPSAAPSSSRSPRLPERSRPLSQWQTREGEIIRIGDARLKNPAKWGLLRR